MVSKSMDVEKYVFIVVVANYLKSDSEKKTRTFSRWEISRSFSLPTFIMYFFSGFFLDE